MDKTIELTIKSTYLPNWTVWDGIREVIQNAKDGDTEGFAMKVCHSGNILRVENVGARLPHQALLLGHTTKYGKDNQIGQFGEGFKALSLVLVRSGRAIKIWSGDELWVPSIRKSENFGEEVLMFDITKTDDCGSIIVEVELSADEWEEYRKNFLFLNDVVVMNECANGSIIFNKELAGRIYVKGIFVQQEENFRYGYDLKFLKVDRDRKMVSGYDLKKSIANLWENVLFDNKCYNSFAELVESDFKDLSYIESTLSTYFIPYDACDLVLNRFRNKHGAKVIPVETEGDALELSHFGAHCVVTSNKRLILVTRRVLGEVNYIKNKLAGETIKEYKFNELNSIEKKNLIRACLFVQKAMKINRELRSTIRIVDFGSKEIHGQWNLGEIKISKSILIDFILTLSVVIHEVAHDYGMDGWKEHVRAIESGWQKVIAELIET